MASSYYDKSGKNVNDGDIAYANDLNQINEAVDTGFQGVETDILNIQNDAIFYSDLAQKWAENPEDTEVEPGKFSALHHAAKASDDATAANNSANTAAASETAAGVSETNASNSETNAAASETAAGISETNAAASELKASEWADKAEDDPVETGPDRYSAFHWAQKAADSVGGLISDDIYGPTWDGDVDTGASKNALYDKIETLVESTDLDGYVSKTSTTGQAEIPSGTTAQRDAASAGDFRFNTDDVQFEGYNGTEWGAIGGGGGLDWTSPVQSTDFTAEAEKGYAVDTSGGQVIMTLPVGADGDSVAYKDEMGSFDTFNMILRPDGSDTIEGNTGDYIADTKSSAATLVFKVGQGWLFVTHTSMETGVVNKPYMRLVDDVTSSFSFGTGLFDINVGDIVYNDIPGASKSSATTFTLPAGTYYVRLSSHVRGSSTTGAAFVELQDSGGSTVYGRSEASELTTSVQGFTRVTVGSSTIFKLESDSQGADTVVVKAGQTVSRTSIDIWQLDAEVRTPVATSSQSYNGGTYLTGSINGLEYEKTGANQVTVKMGDCMDSTNTVPLALLADTPLSVPTVINQVYNIFIVKETAGGAISLRTDTDVDGANLTGVDNFRWIGFVKNNSSGVLAEFSMSGNIFTHGTPIDARLFNPTTLYAQYDHSPFMPVSRVEGVAYGANGASSNIFISLNGVDDVEIFNSVAGTTSPYDFQTAGTAVFLPTDSYFKYVSAQPAIIARQILMRR